jgi:hypothetical protein
MKPVWVGLITVRPLVADSGLAEGRAACVWVAAPASNAEEYLEAARVVFEERGFEAREADDFQPADDANLSAELRELADDVARTQSAATASTFYTFPEEELEDDAPEGA